MSSSHSIAISYKPSSTVEGSEHSSILENESTRAGAESPKKSVRFQLLGLQKLENFYKSYHNNIDTSAKLQTKVEKTAQFVSDLILYELCTRNDRFNVSVFSDTFRFQLSEYCETLETEVTPELKIKVKDIYRSNIKEVKDLLKTDATILETAKNLFAQDLQNTAYQQFWRIAKEESAEGIEQFHTEISKQSNLKTMIHEFVQLILKKTIPSFSPQTEKSNRKFNRFITICGRYISETTFFRWMSLERIESIGTHAPQIKALTVTDVLLLVPNSEIPESIIDHPNYLSPFTELEELKLFDTIPTKEFLNAITDYLKKLRRLAITHKTIREAKQFQIGGLSKAQNLTLIELKGSLLVLKQEWEELIADIPNENEPTSVKAVPNLDSIILEDNAEIEDDDLWGLRPRTSELKHLEFSSCPKIQGVIFKHLSFIALTTLKIVGCRRITPKIVGIAGAIDTLREFILECGVKFTPETFQNLKPAKGLKKLTVYYAQLFSKQALNALLEIPNLIRLTIPKQTLEFKDDRRAQLWNGLKSRRVQILLDFVEYNQPAGPIEEEEEEPEELIPFPVVLQSDSSTSESEESSEDTPRSDKSITPRSDDEMLEIPIQTRLVANRV